MIRHIVMWKFKESEEENAKKFLAELSALGCQIEVIKHLEVKTGINSPNNYDAVLISDFESMEDLDKYKNDPRHVRVSALCKNIRVNRASVDYEL